MKTHWFPLRTCETPLFLRGFVLWRGLGLCMFVPVKKSWLLECCFASHLPAGKLIHPRKKSAILRLFTWKKKMVVALFSHSPIIVVQWTTKAIRKDTIILEIHPFSTEPWVWGMVFFLIVWVIPIPSNCDHKHHHHSCALCLVHFFLFWLSPPSTEISSSHSWLICRKLSNIIINPPTNHWLKFAEKEIWLMVSTHLKNISQNGNLPQIGVKIKNLWKHHLEMFNVVAIHLD